MRKKWYMIALIVMVGVGVSFAGCKKAGDPKAMEEFCAKTGEAAVEAQKANMPAGMPAEEVTKLAEGAKKACMESASKMPDDEKNAAYRQAADKLEKCKDKKGQDFITCAGQ